MLQNSYYANLFTYDIFISRVKMGSYLTNELSALQGLIEQLSKIFQTLPQAVDYKILESPAGKMAGNGLSKFKSSPSESKPGRILTSGVVMIVLTRNIFVPFLLRAIFQYSAHWI